MPVSNQKLVSVPLFSEHLVLAAPADIPDRPKAGINGFCNSGFIFVSPSVSKTFHDHVLSLCLRAGFTPRVVQEANEILTILHLVRAGLGCLWSRGQPCASKCRECDFMNWAGRSRCGASASHGIGTRRNSHSSLVYSKSCRPSSETKRSNNLKTN
jgi:hypothetical protein